MSKARATYHKDLVIASGGTNSAWCPCACWAIASVQLPTAFTGSSISFQVTNDTDADGVPENWAAAQDHEGNNIGSITVSASDTLPIHPEVLDGRFFRIVSASAEAAERTLKVTLKS